MELLEKNLLNEVSYIILTNDSYESLMNEFKEEFESEYFELNVDPSFYDLQDHLGVRIIKDRLENGQKYQILAKV